ncbi:MAG: hypothetical protein LQ352_005850 [Teloschistes flavicans]|nr:MAG: hypothetical protein LQ352_005850 [Teloschistes flavicans]
MCEDCMWIYRHYEACVFCQAPIDHSTIELPRSYRTQNASDELEVHPRSTKRIKREETNDDQTPTRSANEQQTMQRATEIKQRIRARHPDLIYYPDLLTFKTKYRHKLADDNTLYTTFRGVLSNAAVLVYKHTALDIYIVANLDLTIIPVAKALWATINGSRPDQALSSIEQLMSEGTNGPEICITDDDFLGWRD